MEYIQLQHHPLAHMMLGIAQGGAAKPICLGISGDEHMDQKQIDNPLLDRFQHLVRDRQVTESAALLGQADLAIMLAQIVTDGISIGIVTFLSVCRRVAPSICEASCRSRGIFCKPAI